MHPLCHQLETPRGKCGERLSCQGPAPSTTAEDPCSRSRFSARAPSEAQVPVLANSAAPPPSHRLCTSGTAADGRQERGVLIFGLEVVEREGQSGRLQARQSLHTRGPGQDLSLACAAQAAQRGGESELRGNGIRQEPKGIDLIRCREMQGPGSICGSTAKSQNVRM